MGAGSLLTETIGTAPNRTFVIEWNKFSDYNTSVSNIAFDFQLRLEETSNIIRFVYGSYNNTVTTVYTSQVGLRGATNADFNNRTAALAAGFNNTMAGTANNATVARDNVSFPASGLTFSWSPASCTVPSNVNTASVTSTSATINWTAPATPPSNGYLYEVRSSGAAGSGATGLAASGNTAAGVTTANVSGLAPATTYSIYVQSNCGAAGTSNWSLASTFTTLCNVFSAPFAESFNVGVLPNCWANSNTINSTTANLLWKFGSGFGYGAASNGRTAGTFAFVDASSPYNAIVTLTSPVIDLSSLTSPYIMFDWFKNNTDPAATRLNNNLLVEGYNGTSWVSLFNDTSNSSSWRTVGLTLPAGFAGVTNAQFRFSVDKSLSNNFYDDLLLDSFAVTNTPSCTAPATVSTSSVTINGATISWTASTSSPASGYEYEVRSSGTAGSGTTGLAASGSTAAGVLTASVTGLTGATTYTVYVRSNCGAGNVSSWSSASFTTSLDCGTATAISACGVAQTFNIPAGNGVWDMSTATPAGPYSTPGKEMLYTFTPPTTGVYTLDVTAANSGTYADYFVKPVSGGCDINGWMYWDDVLNPGTDTMTLQGGVQYYILVDLESNSAATTQTFSIICPPSCGVPNTLTASAITTTAATISWTQPATGSASQWQLSYGPTGTTAAAGTKAIATANPAQISGLTPATGYTVYVRAICGTGDTSAWSSSVSFTTQCLPATIPFTENFNSSTFPPACWSVARGWLSQNAALTAGTGSWISDDYMNASTNTLAARINLYSNFRRDWLISPSINLGTTTNTYQLSFKLGVTNYSSTTVSDSLGSDDTVAVVVSYNDGATWNLSDTLRVWTRANGQIPSQIVTLPITASGTIKFAFYGSEGVISSTPDNDIFIDSVSLLPCTPPVVALGNDTGICAGSTLTLNAGNTGATYLWSTGATTQTIAVTTAGTYNVRVTNANGCIGRDTLVVTVNPLPVVNLGNDTSFCAGNTLTLSAGNAGASYLWSTGATTQTISATNSGTYSVSVTNATGCIGRDTISVTVNALPTVALGNDTAICSGNSLTLSAGNTGATYLWSTGATTQTLNVTAAGTYSVRVTNASGCIGRDTINVTVNPLPVVALGNDTAICAGTTLALTAGNTGATYLWSTGATTQSITASTAGTYSVRVTNANGCIGRDTLVVTVNPLPVVNLGNDTSFCAGNTLTLSAGNTGATYLWSTGATTQSITASTAGTYSVRVTNANGCIGRDTINVTVNPLPVAGTIAYTGANGVYQFSANGTTNVTGHSWDFGDQSAGATTAIASHTYAANGTYTVIYRVANSCGIDSATTTVTVSGIGVSSVPSVDAKVELFPNPATEFVTVRNSSSVAMKRAVILNAVGAVVKTQELAGTKEARIEISGLAAGSYMVHIDMEGTTVIRRMQITR